MIWVYSFVLWPANSSFGTGARYERLRLAAAALKMPMRQEHEWTEDDFKRARAELETVGLEMHEIERWPRPTTEVVL